MPGKKDNTYIVYWTTNKSYQLNFADADNIGWKEHVFTNFFNNSSIKCNPKLVIQRQILSVVSRHVWKSKSDALKTSLDKKHRSCTKLVKESAEIWEL